MPPNILASLDPFQRDQKSFYEPSPTPTAPTVGQFLSRDQLFGDATVSKKVPVDPGNYKSPMQTVSIPATSAGVRARANTERFLGGFGVDISHGGIQKHNAEVTRQQLGQMQKVVEAGVLTGAVKESEYLDYLQRTTGLNPEEIAKLNAALLPEMKADLASEVAKNHAPEKQMEWLQMLNATKAGMKAENERLQATPQTDLTRKIETGVGVAKKVKNSIPGY